MISNDALEKAASSAQGKPEAAPLAPVTATSAPIDTAKVEAKIEAPIEQPKKEELTDQEWDGDPNKLPPELQKWAKKAQGTLTKKAMSLAEERRLAEEFKRFQSSPEWQNYQTWKQQGARGQENPNVQESMSRPAQSGVTQQEWEDARLDETGSKFSSLVNRMVNQQINQAAQVYGQELQQLRSTQQVTQFQQTLSDFADLNPDVVKLHEMGIMKPLLEEEMKNGKHKSYDEMVQAAYERGSKIREAAYQDALTATQGRVQEKKAGVINTGTTSAEANVAYVDKGSTFEEAFNYALQNKKVKVKAKQ